MTASAHSEGFNRLCIDFLSMIEFSFLNIDSVVLRLLIALYHGKPADKIIT
jgi:hypothetical protein